ncbi:AAA family ATPase [Desulfosarcina sp. OttesenSCG-928-B08]|nr:AAA family ATPase [Desulfosarcina sp. OttesenSCG-928-B08]
MNTLKTDETDDSRVLRPLVFFPAGASSAKTPVADFSRPDFFRPDVSRSDHRARIIRLRERTLNMLKNDLLLRNPLRLMGPENRPLVPEGGFGAVVARAGVGKTALMVQVAFNTLLQQKNVLHVSLDDPVDKVNVWYQEVLSGLAHQYHVRQIRELWESIQMHRFIMTFKVEGFSVPKLEERVTDLTEQEIFNPHMVIIDGLPFEGEMRAPLEGLKAFSEKHRIHLWFTVTTHQDDTPGPDGLPVQLETVSDLFDAVIQLQPDGKTTRIRCLKGCLGDTADDQCLDPATMLIQAS